MIYHNEIPAVFNRLLLSAGENLSTLSPRAGVELMLQFYSDFRVRNCELANDGDMLLVQWGTYDWGQDRYFEFDITRQLIPDVFEPEIWQLSLTFKYFPSGELSSISQQNRWLDTPAEIQLESFRDFIIRSRAFQMVSLSPPTKVELDYENVE